MMMMQMIECLWIVMYFSIYLENYWLWLYFYCMNEYWKHLLCMIWIVMYFSKRLICAIVIYLYLHLLSTISGMDSTSRQGKSSTRGRERGRRSSVVDPTAMGVNQSFSQLRQTPVQLGAIMASYIPGLSRPIPSPIGTFHHQIPYIPNYKAMHNQFAYNIPPNPLFSTLFTLLPHPLTLTQTSPKKTLQMESEA